MIENFSGISYHFVCVPYCRVVNVMPESQSRFGGTLPSNRLLSTPVIRKYIPFSMPEALSEVNPAGIFAGGDRKPREVVWSLIN